jgi:hypothetical protein
LSFINIALAVVHDLAEGVGSDFRHQQILFAIHIDSGRQGAGACRQTYKHGTKKQWVNLVWAVVHKLAFVSNEIDLKKNEGKMILEWLEKDDVLIALDERGKEMSSEDLANFIIKRGNMGCKKLIFLIGGAFGIDSTVMERADFTWSLSKRAEHLKSPS